MPNFSIFENTLPRNGSGTYSLPAGNPVVTGTTISSTVQNNTTSDIATALTQSIAVDGQSVVTANIPFGGHKLTGVAAATTSGDALIFGQTNASMAGLTLTAPLVMTGAAINESQGADIASAGTIDLDAATGNLVDVTGTTSITAVTLSQGRRRLVRFTGILTLTNGASLVLPGGANITTAAGDFALFEGYAAGVVRVAFYSKISGLPVVQSTVTQVQTVSGTVAASALTAGYAGGTLDFRSATLTSGTVSTLVVGALSLVVSSGSTLGTVSGLPARLWLAVINNAGTGELAIINTQLGNGQIAPVNESTLISTTAEGGAGGADTAGVWYSTTARSNVPFRLVGYLECTEATAGTWATAPAVIEGVSAGTRKPGDLVQSVYNITGAVATGGTALPIDDSIPQIGEGNEFMTQAITPSSAINSLAIHHTGVYANASASTRSACALFQDATANALAAVITIMSPNAANGETTMVLDYSMRAGLAVSTTFRIRVGNNAATVTTFNGSATARTMGGVMASILTVSEIFA